MNKIFVLIFVLIFVILLSACDPVGIKHAATEAKKARIGEAEARAAGQVGVANANASARIAEAEARAQNAIPKALIWASVIVTLAVLGAYTALVAQQEDHRHQVPGGCVSSVKRPDIRETGFWMNWPDCPHR